MAFWPRNWDTAVVQGTRPASRILVGRGRSICRCRRAGCHRRPCHLAKDVGRHQDFHSETCREVLLADTRLRPLVLASLYVGANGGLTAVDASAAGSLSGWAIFLAVDAVVV